MNPFQIRISPSGVLIEGAAVGDLLIWDGSAWTTGPGGAGTAGTSAERTLVGPQVILATATDALVWGGGDIAAVTSVPGEAVIATMSMNRANAAPPGAGGVYQFLLDGAGVGLSPNDDGDWSSTFAYTVRIVIPAAGAHTVGVQCTAQTGNESVFQSTLVVQGANVS